MASLLGKADSTIGSMSYREAMADVMPDYSDIYKQKAEGFEKNQLAFQKAVGDYFDIQHADNNKLADELKQATTKAMEGLGTDYGSMELFNSHLTSMKDRMKALPKTKKGDFERSKIRAEMNQLLESSNGLSDTLAEVGTMIKAGDFNIHTTDYPILNAINDGTAKKEIVDGNLVYSFVDAKGKKQTIDRRGIKDALGQSDLEIDGNFIKQGPEAFKLGKQGGKFNRNKSVNGYEKMFTSPAGLAANMNEKQGGLEYTFVESLAGKDGSQSIYKALTNMGATTVAKYDANNDNRITAADFANPENGIELIESLTNPRSDNYNFQAAKTAAAEFYADNIDQVEFNDGRSLRPAKTVKKESTLKNPERGGFLYGTNSTGFDDSHPDESKRSRVLNIGFDQMVRNRNALLPKNVIEGSEIQGEHYVYKFNGDTWQAFYDGKKIKDVRGSQIASWEGLLSPVDIQGGDGLPMFDIGTATYKKNKEKEEKKSLEKPLTPGGIGLTSINSNSINDIERNIQSTFVPQFATDFNISPVYKNTYSLEQKGNVQRIVKNKIKITGPSGFEEIYNVGPGSTAEIADQITNDILEVSDYRKQVDPDLLVN